MQRYLLLLIVIALTLAAACFNALDRDLDFLAPKNAPFEAFAKAVCFADSIVTGVTFSILLLRFSSRFGLKEPDLSALLENLAGIFVLYSVIVGTGMCLYNFQAIPKSQIIEYIIAIVFNWKYVQAFQKSDL